MAAKKTENEIKTQRPIFQLIRNRMDIKLLNCNLGTNKNYEVVNTTWKSNACFILFFLYRSFSTNCNSVISVSYLVSGGIRAIRMAREKKKCAAQGKVNNKFLLFVLKILTRHCHSSHQVYLYWSFHKDFHWNGFGVLGNFCSKRHKNVLAFGSFECDDAISDVLRQVP